MGDAQINILSIQSFARKAGRIMGIIFSIVLACILILVGVLQLWSPGKPLPFVDSNGEPLAGSLSEKIFVNINGVEQGMFIKSKDTRNPVLLYLHGGMPDYFLTQKYPAGRDFTPLPSRRTAPSLKKLKNREIFCARTCWQEQIILLTQNRAVAAIVHSWI